MSQLVKVLPLLALVKRFGRFENNRTLCTRPLTLCPVAVTLRFNGFNCCHPQIRLMTYKCTLTLPVGVINWPELDWCVVT